MSFWSLSTNEQLTTNGTMEMGGGNLPPIPANTVLLAMVTEAKWDMNDATGEELIKLRWDVIEGEYKKRVIFQKIRVKDHDSKKRDKAIRMLAAIDANAGGQLMASDQEPNDMALAAALCNKMMRIKVGVWRIDEDPSDIKEGNWVQAVSSSKPAAAPAVAPAAQPAAPSQSIGF